MFEKIKQLLIENTLIKTTDISLESRLVVDLGLDSLSLAIATVALEDEFGITIPDRDIPTLVCVKDIIDYIEKKKGIDNGQGQSIKNLKELVSNGAKKYPMGEIFRIRTSKNEYKSILWNQFQADINYLGTALISKGLKNKKICVIGENIYEWVVTYLAVTNGVGVIVPMDKELSEKEIKNIITDCDAACVIYTKTFEEIMKTINLSKILFICIDSPEEEYLKLLQSGKKLLEEGETSFVSAELDENALAAIVNSSGTTGASKGIMLSHKNIVENVKAAAENIYFNKEDITMSILPLHHSYEFTCNILCIGLYCGAIVCFNESLRYLRDNFSLFKPTTTCTVPQVLNMMRNFELGSGLKKVIVGGAAADPDIINSFSTAGILVLQGYGITECAPLVAVNKDKLHKAESVGLPIPCNEVKIIDDEICVKGANVMLGYYNNDQATRDAFTDKQEWFKTGDLGYFDDEGFLYISGRKKNLIILDNGKNVYPEDLENLLSKVSGIKEVMVYEDKNYITAEIFTTTDMLGNIEEQISEINKQLPFFKQIQIIKFRSIEFEKTTTGKIKRF